MVTRNSIPLIILLMAIVAFSACSDPCKQLLDKACKCSPLDCSRYHASIDMQKKLPRVVGDTF